MASGLQMPIVMMDLRYALQTLRKSPGFTATAILTLALGIGSSTAIFTLLDQVSLRLLPVKHPEQLVMLRWDGTWWGSNYDYASWSYPWYEDLEKETDEVFEQLFGYHDMEVAVGSSGDAEQLDVAFVTGNYFGAIGIGTAAGRTLEPGDNETLDGHPVAVLSYDFWRDCFANDPEVVGQTILLNQYPFEVIGVAQQSFHGINCRSRPKVFIPTMMKNSVSVGFHRDIYHLTNRRSRWLHVFGRLRSGVSLAQAEAALAPVMKAGIEYDLV
jgi:putative ABC transport system permease protein